MALVPLELVASDSASRHDAGLRADVRGNVRTLWRRSWSVLWLLAQG